MSSSETLFKATLNRLSARLAKSLYTLGSEFGLAFKDVPERFKEEFDLFRQEVFDEAERLENEDKGREATSDFVATSNSPGTDQTQEIVDRLRSKIAQLGKKVEGVNK